MFQFSMVIAIVIIFNGPNGGQTLRLSQRNYACDFLNSINITDGKINAADKSISYNGITFARNQYSVFDYRLIDGGERVPTAKHLRGCPCLKRPCIRLYCIPGFDSRMERGCKYRTNFTDYTMDILDRDNRNQSVNIVEHFSYVVDRPCERFVQQAPGTWQLKHVSGELENQRRRTRLLRILCFVFSALFFRSLLLRPIDRSSDLRLRAYKKSR